MPRRVEIETAPLTRADLAPKPRMDIASIREAHHAVARLLVSGLTNLAISERTGYSLGRLVQLKASPAFQELMASYRGMVDDTWLATHDEMYSTIGRATAKAWRQVEEHLDEADETNEKIPLKTLLAVAADGSDRVGYMKKSATLNANIDFAKHLEAAIRRSKEPKTIDGEAA